VKGVGVSDRVMPYAADIAHGGTKDRLYVSLDEAAPPEVLWWLSVHGIYREVEVLPQPTSALPEEPVAATAREELASAGEVLHPKYHVPARCFGYVGNAAEHGTWKLPYLCAWRRPRRNSASCPDKKGHAATV